MVDLANAFSCLPLAVESRPFFAFTYRETAVYLYEDAPGIPVHSHYLQRLPEERPGRTDSSFWHGAGSVQLVHGVTNHAEKGYKLKKTKLQLVKEQITFLGKVIGGNKREISEGHKNTAKTTQSQKQSNKC